MGRGSGVQSHRCCCGGSRLASESVTRDAAAIVCWEAYLHRDDAMYCLMVMIHLCAGNLN